MSKVKTKRRGINIDMTPMVDVAFLLLTFFMLTTKFRPPEAIKIDLPFSHSQLKLPDTDLLTVTVSSNNTYLIALSSQQSRERLFNALVAPELQTAKISGIVIADSLNHFRLAENFRVGESELEKFVGMAHSVNPKLRPVIRADANAGFAAVNRVIKIYKKANMLTFNLVTVLEREVR